MTLHASRISQVLHYAFQKSFGAAAAEVNRKFSKIILPFSEENHSKKMWDFQSIVKRSDAIRIRVTVSHTVDYHYSNNQIEDHSKSVSCDHFGYRLN